MGRSFKYHIVDDDHIFIKVLTKYLTSDRHTVTSNTSSSDALQQIRQLKPDCVILDIMMPGIDGLELCQQIKSDTTLKDIAIIIVTGKTYETDRKRAFDLGADGYIVKPVDPNRISSQIERIVEDRIELIFWGVRGTLPVPGKETIRYGGNTSCVSLEFPRGSLFIFDAGTGIKALSDQLMSEERQHIEAKIFISHPHWDHINAFPFFTPLYVQGNEFDIFGPYHGDVSIRELIAGQMDGVYFPIKIKAFGATISFQDLKEEIFSIDGIRIQTLLLNHPGHCLGYRIDYKDRSVCYITDNELFPQTSKYYNEAYIQKLKGFIQGTDALITDSTFNDDEYEDKMCWGHSQISEVIKLADSAKVGTVYILHHDPGQTDDSIDAKWEKANTLLEQLDSQTTCIAPKEKQLFKI
jgi:CheY-like chemotaxis protein